MQGIDTNILFSSRLKSSPDYQASKSFLEGIGNNTEVVIAELVLVELYTLLRNPILMSPVLSAKEAVKTCNIFRKHPSWRLVEHADVMNDVWKIASQPHFARRRIFDVRLAKTLQAHGVTEFATANVKDFQNLGFKKVWNPLLKTAIRRKSTVTD